MSLPGVVCLLHFEHALYQTLCVLSCRCPEKHSLCDRDKRRGYMSLSIPSRSHVQSGVAGLTPTIGVRFPRSGRSNRISVRRLRNVGHNTDESGSNESVEQDV